MTYNDIVSQVQAHGFSDVQSSDVGRWVNDSYFHICGVEDWPFLEGGPSTLTFPSDSTPNNLPTDFGKVVSLTNSSAKLTGLNRGAFISIVNSSGVSATGTPKYYTTWSNTVRIHPAPTGSTNLTLWYLKDPATLSGTDVPLIPERYHHVIVQGAIVRGYQEKDDTEMLVPAEKRFNELLQQMTKDLMDNQLDSTELAGDPYTLLAMQQEIRDAGADDLGSSLLTNYINASIAEVASRQPWPYLQKGPTTIACTVGNPVLNTPDEFNKPMVLLDDQGYRLRYDTPDAFADDTSYARVNGTTGRPYEYTLWTYTADDTSGEQAGVGPGLRLFPTPDQAYNMELWYYSMPSTLSSATDRVNMPPEYRELVILGALVRACNITSNEKLQMKKAALKTEFEDRITQMQNDVLRNNYDRPTIARDVGYDEWGI